MNNIVIRGLRRLRNDPKSLFVHLFRTTIGKTLSDVTYLRIMNHVYMHKSLNLKNPQTFNEKLQWLKLHDRKPRYTGMVDKYEAKKYISKIIGEEYIIPTLGVWDRFEDIDFDSLPNQFVLKCTHDSGGLVICRDKTQLNMEDTRRKITTCLRQRYYWIGREWPYKNVKPRIIAEKYMENDGEDELIDYKWFCFEGKPEFLYISHGLANHETATIDFYDMNHNRMPFKRMDYKSSAKDAPKPITYDEMVKLSKKISSGIPFLRVDLYEINGKVYFSELTFYPCAGWLPFDPPEWDLELGKYIQLPR
ncbi:glycosyl transferase [bacterium 210820-DFI.6.37]|nr:glycosyl transferase [bacterium 210820-DFI.6.37]